MKTVEILPNGSFLVSEERVNNDILLWICEYGSIWQLMAILEERLSKEEQK